MCQIVLVFMAFFSMSTSYAASICRAYADLMFERELVQRPLASVGLKECFFCGINLPLDDPILPFLSMCKTCVLNAIYHPSGRLNPRSRNSLCLRKGGLEDLFRVVGVKEGEIKAWQKCHSDVGKADYRECGSCQYGVAKLDLTKKSAACEICEKNVCFYLRRRAHRC
jgi:hypothetical protein